MAAKKSEDLNKGRQETSADLGITPAFIINLFRGRIGRKHFILSVVILYVTLLSSIGLMTLFEETIIFEITIFVIVWILFTLTITLFLISLFIRRLHDLGHSGWMFLTLLIPIINIIVFFSLIFSPGKEGVNTFGVSPYPGNKFLDAFLGKVS